MDTVNHTICLCLGKRQLARDKGSTCKTEHNRMTSSLDEAVLRLFESIEHSETE